MDNEDIDLSENDEPIVEEGEQQNIPQNVEPEQQVVQQNNRPICWFCLGDDNLPDLRICSCKGTQGFIHFECLRGLIRGRLQDPHRERCGVCKLPFNKDIIDIKYIYDERNQRPPLRGHLLEIMDNNFMWYIYF